MSTDFNVVCDRCKVFHHLGQEMTGVGSFGYGPGDAEGRQSAFAFIVKHLYHDPDCGDGRHGTHPRGEPKSTCGADSLRLVLTDNIPDGYADGKERQP